MQIVLNLSPYVVNYLNSFQDMNPSQVTESIVRQYINATRKVQSNVVDPYVTERAEKQRVQPNRAPRASPVMKRTKNLKPTK
jgi:hypothetical protein